MRKFLVYYRNHLVYGEYEYYTKEFVLNTGEKANVDTFEHKLNELGMWRREILSWSLIEE
jgi:hypothetical protein